MPFLKNIYEMSILFNIFPKLESDNLYCIKYYEILYDKLIKITFKI